MDAAGGGGEAGRGGGGSERGVGAAADGSKRQRVAPGQHAAPPAPPLPPAHFGTAEQALIEQTAGFIASNGMQVVGMLLQNQKLGFLHPQHPQHPHFRAALDAARLGPLMGGTDDGNFRRSG